VSCRLARVVTGELRECSIETVHFVCKDCAEREIRVHAFSLLRNFPSRGRSEFNSVPQRIPSSLHHVIARSFLVQMRG
jgi:hypothetical protein